MDVLSLVGIILAFVAIVGGNFLEGGHAGALLNGPAALIVIGGTLAAALLQTPVNVLKRGLGMLGWVFFPPREDLSGGIDRIVSWSMTARKEGLLGLESIADDLARWQEAGIDGVNVIYQTTPGSFVDFIEHVVPVLQARGLAQTEYGPGTYRERLFAGRGPRLNDRHPAARYRGAFLNRGNISTQT